MKGAARFLIKGTVQGVFFRQFVKEEAQKLNLNGFCRNLESGDVEIFVEGEKNAIDTFEERIRIGPKHAQIREVLREDRRWSGDYKSFDILRI